MASKRGIQGPSGNMRGRGRTTRRTRNDISASVSPPSQHQLPSESLVSPTGLDELSVAQLSVELSDHLMTTLGVQQNVPQRSDFHSQEEWRQMYVAEMDRHGGASSSSKYIRFFGNALDSLPALRQGWLEFRHENPEVTWEGALEWLQRYKKDPIGMTTHHHAKFDGLARGQGEDVANFRFRVEQAGKPLSKSEDEYFRRFIPVWVVVGGEV